MTAPRARLLAWGTGVAAVAAAVTGHLILAMTLCLACLLWLAESQRPR